MKSPIAVLRGWWRKRKERRKRGAEKGGASKPVRAGEGRTIEPLEGRIAPATLLDPSTLVYHDLDGDTVTVRFSKPLFDQPAAVLNTLLNSVFIFSAGDAHSGTDTPQQLQLIDLTKVPKAGAIDRVSGTSLTITAEPGAGGGNGLADIGAIEASGLTFKRITIDGDLGQIDCGNAVVTTSLRALDVVTLGAKGLTTQTPVAGTGADAEADRADKLESRIVGGVGAVSASGDFQGYLHVVHGTQFVGSQNVISAPGKIGRIEIAGSLKGAPEIVAESNNTALIETAGDIGTALIGTDTSEGIVGGGGTNSGALICGGDLKNLEVSGSILGGGGANSGRVAATKALGSVVIGNDLVGGDGAGSGGVHSTQAIRALLVGDDVFAGKGARTGVVSSDGSIGTVTVRGDLLGTVLGNLEGAGARSGGISAAGDINFVTVNGNVVGGTETLTGFIESHAAVKKVTINGSLIGGRGLSSGIVATGGSLDDITVLGALSGGAGDNSGSILVGTDPNQPGALSRVKVDGDFLPGPGGTTLGAALFGGSGDNSGMIRAGDSIGKMFLGNAAITTTLLGGAGHFSGAIFSDAGIASIDLVRASGGDGDYSASITAHGLVQKAAVTLAGGAGSGSGSLRALDLITADREIGGRIGSFRGAATGGAGELSGSVWSDGGAGEIIGVFTAGAGARSGSLTTGAGLTSDGDVQTIEINANGAASVRPSIQVNGSIGKVEAGSLSETDFHVSGAIGAMQVTGSLRDVLLTVGAIGSEGRPATAVLGKLTVGGNVERSQILAGFDLEREPVNPDAVIGKVQIGGNWVASDLVAGARDVDQNGFGNEDDRPIGIGAADLQARIAQIVVRGTVTGTADSATDHYGFVSEQIGSVSINGVRVVLDSIAADLKSLDSTNNDLFLREVRTV